MWFIRGWCESDRAWCRSVCEQDWDELTSVCLFRWMQGGVLSHPGRVLGAGMGRSVSADRCWAVLVAGRVHWSVASRAPARKQTKSR